MAFHELLGDRGWPSRELHDRIGAQIEDARRQEVAPPKNTDTPVNGVASYVEGRVAATVAAFFAPRVG